MTNRSPNPAVQGEGDIEADRHYREATQAFVDAGKVQPAADAAAPASAEEAQALKDAEQAGLSKARN